MSEEAEADGATAAHLARVRRMRAQLLTVLGCIAAATTSYFIALAVVW